MKRKGATEQSKQPVVIIGGSGFGERLGMMRAERRMIDTAFGNVPVLVSRHADRDVFAIQRHGKGHTVPPHKVNYRAIIRVAEIVEAKAILASSAVGVINTDCYAPKDLILGAGIMPWHLTIDGGPVTFFSGDGQAVHTDLSEPFSFKLNQLLLRTAEKLGSRLRAGATLVTTQGPRYETVAEIRTFHILGYSLVGMTTAYEAILAAEVGIPYAVVAVGTNPAAGISGKRLSHEEVKKVFKERAEDIFKLFMGAIERM